jgi:membrane fusion protein (multidrug efflux system)
MIPHSHSRWLVFLIFLTAIILPACKKEQPSANAPGPRPGGGGKGGPIEVEAYVVKSGTLNENLEVAGTLMPFEETEIRPEISGRIVNLLVQEGAHVQRGALLAKLFDDDLQAQLKKLQVQLEIAQKTLERQRELLKINGISQQEVDLSELQVNNIKADMELVRVSISKTEIRAPYAGKLGLRYISLGAYVSPATLITTLRQVNQLKLDFTVPEKYGDHFAKGKTVEFTVAGANLKFRAAVLATESKVESNTRSLRVRAQVQGSHPNLIPGAFAKVALTLGAGKSSILVPSQAIIPQARNKKVVLFSAGAPQFQIVDTGIRDSSMVQITDGLKVGDTVVITGLLAIRPDSKLKLSKIK